jgi:hypothetical protein
MYWLSSLEMCLVAVMLYWFNSLEMCLVAVMYWLNSLENVRDLIVHVL